jgi:hypothetical protein
MGLGSKLQALDVLPTRKEPTYCKGSHVVARVDFDGYVKECLLPPVGFKHRTVQPVVDRYIDCAVPVPSKVRRHRNTEIVTPALPSTGFS